MMTLANHDQQIRDAYVLQQGQMRDEARVGVLVVDDDRAIRDTLRFMLEDVDYPVFDAADGMAALDILRRSRRPLVVLLDLMMPRLDGTGVLRVVGDERWLINRCRFIVLTANMHACTPALTSLLSRVDAEVVRKPFDIDTLLDAVDRAACELTAARRDTTAPSSSYAGRPLYH